MIKTLLLLIFSLSQLMSYEPSMQTRQEVEVVAQKLFELFYRGDYKQIDRTYVHPRYGFYFLYRIGVPDSFIHHTQLEEAGVSRYITFAKKHAQKIHWQKPRYLCEYNKWDRVGIFIHQAPYSTVSKIMAFDEKYNERTYAPEQKERIAFLESDTYVLVHSQCSAALYIKKINGRWYLTHIDTLPSDCSA
jgi:hypothetical protein